jgi:DNA (cytosine-5)-methyltransferase 1
MPAYYNEIDPYAAQWLRNLIDAGHIAPGVVDERSIEDVRPSDLSGFTQCHFFAGVGVWSLALRRAGWADDVPVWTGSCPCQPFSAAGSGAGFADPRHLWPSFAWLIKQCGPPVIFGEQVASKAVEPWVDLVHADLEAMEYAFGAVPFPSAGVGAPHIRDRLFWVADAYGKSGNQRRPLDGRRNQGGNAQPWSGSGSDGLPGGLAHAHGGDSSTEREQRSGQQRQQPENSRIVRLAQELGRAATHATAGFWKPADWLFCRDGQWRPVEPGTSPLAHGIANRVGRLRAYGNAINAEAANQFIAAYLES